MDGLAKAIDILIPFNSFVSDTVSLGFVLFWCYLFVSVLCESVFT